MLVVVEVAVVGAEVDAFDVVVAITDGVAVGAVIVVVVAAGFTVVGIVVVGVVVVGVVGVAVVVFGVVVAGVLVVAVGVVAVGVLPLVFTDGLAAGDVLAVVAVDAPVPPPTLTFADTVAGLSSFSSSLSPPPPSSFSSASFSSSSSRRRAHSRSSLSHSGTYTPPTAR